MSKLKYIFAVVVAMMGIRVAANTVAITGGSGHPGDDVTVALSMSGTDPVTALEAVIPLGDYLSYVDGSATLSSARSDGHQLTASVVNGNLRIYVYSLGLKPFKGTSGQLLTFKLRLGATAADLSLTPSVVLSNAAGESVNCSASGASMTVLSPMLEIATQQINYGHVPIRSTYEANLTLRNIGNEPLTVSAITADDAELSVSPASMTIAAGSSVDVAVTYSPLKRGPFSAKLSVVSNAVNAKKYGKWLSAEVVADPFSVNELFVNPASGSSDTEATISLRMSNMEPIVGIQATFYLPEALQYVDGSVAVTSRGTNHQAGASLNGNCLTVFAYSMTNTPFTGSDGDVMTFKVHLDGRNGWYWLSPSDVILSNTALENMTSAVYGEYVVIESPTIYGDSSLDFGKQSIASQMTASYTVGNSGQTNLIIDRVTFLAEGYTVTTPVPLTLAPGENGAIDVSYVTAEAGPFSTTMNVYSNDPEQRVLQVPVSGVGYSPNELALDGRYNDDRMAFVLSVSLDNDAPLAAVQYDITVSPLTSVSGTPEIAKSSRLANHDAYVYDMGNGTWKVLVFSMTNQPIAPANAELMTLTFDMASDCPEATFALEGTVLSSMTGSNIESPELSAVRTYQFKNPSAIVVDKATLSLQIGQTGQLSAEISPVDATDTSVTWSSSDESIATVDANGTVTAVGVGTVTIAAETWNGITAECEVSVTPILAESVTISLSAMSLRIGESGQLTATVLPENTTDKTLTWTTSNPAIATVSDNGVVTALAVGSSIIKVACGSAFATCTVTVNPITAESVALDRAEMTLIEGQTGQLVATVLPENTTDKTVAWSSSDTSVATVAADGTVTALSVGTATITATCGTASATCAITVDPVLAEGVVLDKTSVVMLIGSTDKLTATVLPATTTDKTVTWSSSDASIVTVASDGTITALALGTATITATSVNGMSASCEVTVKPVEPVSITLDNTTLVLEIGETSKLVATVLPDNVTDKIVTWASSDATIVAVDSDGNLMALAIGEADVTARTSNGLTAACHVKVVPIVPTSVQLNYTSLSLTVGQTADLIATVMPDNASDLTVTWSSSNEGVATVDSNGRVTALKSGTATISATTINGLHADCQVAVDKLANAIVWEQTFDEVSEGDVLTLTAYATSQLPVTYTITRGANLATLDGNTLTILAAGEIEVTATQEGDDTWQSAQPVTKTITAYAGLATITADTHVTIVTPSGIIVYRGEMRDIPNLTPDVYIINDRKTLIR